MGEKGAGGETPANRDCTVSIRMASGES
ncbi:hypothetical protein Taro_043100 [Colocasia esculenta]|uniref:Uncharacterized protein n=1 Tax=Colocasia esculenta TaxID=4460 RepID=A0A843WK52_COLES|nr:hypothetical protein [Colocasia esculenta]